MSIRLSARMCVASLVLVAACDSSDTITPTARPPIPLGATAIGLGSEQAEFESAMAPFRYFSGLTAKSRVVVRDAAEWNAMWTSLSSNVEPRPPVPSVDFARQMVIFASMGTRNSGGYSIGIDGVYDASGDLWVSIRETSPSGCAVFAALTAPTTAVVIPRRNGNVNFSELAAVHRCN
jgi:protease stability complex PrcB-like protein